jgi:glycine/D-amino acid oxidase-like deaminating enzyme
VWDYAVVGGGIIGCFAAHFAALRFPTAKGVLVERNRIGTGASRYSGGIDYSYGPTPQRLDWTARSRDWFDRLAGQLPGVRARPLSIRTIVSRDRATELITRFVPGTAELSAAPTDLWPEVRLGPDEVVLAGDRAFVEDPTPVAQRLADLFRRAGGEVREGAGATDLLATSGGYELSLSDGTRLLAARVIVATGPWVGPGLAEEAARAAGVRVKKVAALHLNRRPAPQDGVMFFPTDDAVLVPLFASDGALFSFRCPVWDVAPDPNALALTADDVATAAAVLAVRAPGLERLYAGGRVFCDAYSPTGDPLVLPLGPGGVLVGAASGSGYRLAPALAEDTVRMAFAGR